MSPLLALDFILYGIAMPLLGIFITNKAPELGGIPLVAGFAGGLLGWFWGVCGFMENPFRYGPVFSLVVMAGILVWQTVRALLMLLAQESSSSRVGPVFLFLMLAFTLGELILYANHLRAEAKPHPRFSRR